MQTRREISETGNKFPARIMLMPTPPGRRRRNHKGDRDAMMIRPDALVGHEVRSRADQAGMTISDYVWTLLAQEVDMPERAPATPAARSDQQLPLDSGRLLTG